MESKKRAISSLQPLCILRRSSRISTSSPKDIQVELSDHSLYDSPPMSESEASTPKAKKTRTKKGEKKKRSNGGYVTLNPNIRSSLFEILHEQAQIWYDINFADIKDTLRSIREQQLISNGRLSQDFAKEERGKKEFAEERKVAPKRPSSSSDRFAVLLKKLLVDDPMEIEESCDNFQDPDLFIKGYDEYEDASFYARSNFDEFLEQKFEEMFMPTEDLTVIKDEAPDAKRRKKGKTRISDIPIKPLGIPLTIQTQDIAKYLQHNEKTIIQQNLEVSEKKVSIMMAISDKTGVHFKTLMRIAAGGPERKKGGGRKQLDSEMERKLTVYIVELNKRGRPPTRGEAKKLGQLLSTVPEFRASKGWLDKYIRRAQGYLQEEPLLKEHFNLLTFSKFSEAERKMPILMCLESIGAPDKFLKEFKTMKTKKWYQYFPESESECESEEEPEPMKRLCQNN